MSKSFKNKLEMYGPLILPNTTLGGTFVNYFPMASDAITYHPLLSSLWKTDVPVNDTRVKWTTF